MKIWKDRIYERLKIESFKERPPGNYYGWYNNGLPASDLNYDCWNHLIYPDTKIWDFTEKYRTYMSRTNYAIKQLLKEKKVEIIEKKSLQGGKVYKYVKPTLKINFFKTKIIIDETISTN